MLGGSLARYFRITLLMFVQNGNQNNDCQRHDSENGGAVKRVKSVAIGAVDVSAKTNVCMYKAMVDGIESEKATVWRGTSTFHIWPVHLLA